MSERASNFLADWIGKHVHQVPEGEREQKAEQLTEQCLEDARAQGIHADELNNATQTGLHHYILAELGGIELPPH
ncbi:DUF768 domain-containing protein [Aquisalinus flavus]|uniref:DUF768 domain-containing protein n=1 Tax=Aquisalinus flavus TaxID=1526572 RepID=A0A8J2V661_9PROT|nr:DUF768 domain-containing protein [Aquisalinus flavus]MBD0425662.1 DUF768 domain-containing protein [Aquisalinus flavus]UNE48723.1 DUF768 domain-containing protein [Aquisalinus flavus]GGD14250.1 hypothetical protein GCM10011342_23800 [Aquisalinus flavus]